MNSDLLSQIERMRAEVNTHIDSATRVELGQYLTPDTIARFMASLFWKQPSKGIRLLDPGAGVGSLSAAFIQRVIEDGFTGEIHLTAYELDPLMQKYLLGTMEMCSEYANKFSTNFSWNLVGDDFIHHAVDSLAYEGGFFSSGVDRFTHCIMNPPYKKIHKDSSHRKLLQKIGFETTNLYTAFVGLAIKLLEPNGELVAIIPRSFCNGTYFKPFRKLLLKEMAIRHIHVFDSRKDAFKEDDVLQENIIIYAVKGSQQGDVLITTSEDSGFTSMTLNEVSFSNIVKPKDLEQTIHIVTDNFDQKIANWMSLFNDSLGDLGISVSTGPIVEFRQKNAIHAFPVENTHPLIYPAHFFRGYITWPLNNGRKPNSVVESVENTQDFFPNDWYLLVRRFSSKEETRRIVTALLDPNRIKAQKIGFENHLNVFHKHKTGVDPLVAKGLAVYLSSTLVDLYFRQFSGHTQVNAQDLRNFKYPDKNMLISMGKYVGDEFPSQREIDSILEQEIRRRYMPNNQMDDPIKIQQKIEEALDILESVGMPREQHNERSALTLLAVLNLLPQDSWAIAQNPLIGITPIMTFISENYGKNYAPNTRETIRRQTIHQFLQAGIVIQNPDQLGRPVNSPKTVYQCEDHFLTLVRNYRTYDWNTQLQSYLQLRPSLVDKYSMQRQMQLIPLHIMEKETVYLTPGDHSMLIRSIIEEFGPRFAPGAEVLYVGDTGSKVGYFNDGQFKHLGLNFDPHGKFPDVVLYLAEPNWLYLIEAVTSHGPVNAKRHNELIELFKNSTADLIFITAFIDKRGFSRFVNDISWETDVWIANTPAHLIHFDGEKFFGPYESKK